jgi:hypothetical protein
MRVLLDVVVEPLRVNSCRWLSISKTPTVVKLKAAARDVRRRHDVSVFSLDFIDRSV